MLDPLLRKTLTDLKFQTPAWGFGVGFLLVFMVLIFPIIGETYSELFNQLPKNMAAFYGSGGSMDTLAGFINTEFIKFAPVILSIFAIISGTATIVGEEQRGTLDVILAHPVSRVRLILTKMSGLALSYGMIIVILLIMFNIAVTIANLQAQTGRFIAAFVLLWPFLTTVAFLSILLSMVLSSRLWAGTIMAGLLIFSYILDSVANLVSWLEPLQPLFLTAYYQGSNALVSDISLGYTTGLIATMLASAGLNVYLFIQRDIGIHRQLRLPPWPIANAKNK